MVIHVVSILLLAIAGLFSSVYWMQDRGKQPHSTVSQIEIEQLASFAREVKDYADAYPDFQGPLFWADIRAGFSADSHHNKLSMPQDWFVMFYERKKYVLCAPLSTEAMSQLMSRMPPDSRGMVTRDYRVFTNKPEQVGVYRNQCDIH